MASALAEQAEERIWDRWPNESTQAYARFIAYRDTLPESRSMRKLGISYTLAARWAKRYRWTERVRAWDDHVFVAVEKLGLSAQVTARVSQLDLGLAFVDVSKSAVNQLDKSKMAPEAIVALGESGVRLARQALDLAESNQTKQNTSPIGVAVHVAGHAQVGFAPSWLPRVPESATPVSVAAQPQTKQKETGIRAGSLRLTERIEARAEQNKTNAND